MDIGSEIRGIADRYLDKVRPSGPENVMAICPFHCKSDGSPERHPSFAMSLTSGLWFCHACQSKGNLYTFLRDVGLTKQAIDLQYSPLLEEAKKNLPPQLNLAEPGVVSVNPVAEGLLGIFEFCPTSLLEAGFEERTLRHFDVGFDKDHYRITYPIRDLAGNLVAISGRSVTDDYPKYKIYDTEYVTWGLPERLNWDKRTVLYNAHDVYPQLFFRAKPPDSIIVVEGFKACMWVWQAGIRDVVALLGTYMSEEQKWILERIGAPVYLFLDNNGPGIEGAEKTADKLRKSLRVFIVEYPERLKDCDKAQPDSMEPLEVQRQISAAIDPITWKRKKEKKIWHLGKRQDNWTR